jgi:predicted aspartyl protease
MPVYDAKGFNPPAPLARVTLHDQKSRMTLPNVPMLIDTGADVTLIPKDAVQQLGLAVDLTHGQGYELMGFDGSISVASVVELDLTFLKRTFRGKLLVIDSEVGILGRDILNHVSLLFDGPSLNWDEKQSS